jgi:hypothetical protein
LAEAGGQVAATLAGCGPAELLKLLERLRVLGLVFRYDVGGVATFTAHPFLRGFFEKLLGAENARQVHEAVEADLAAGLDDRPREYPTDPEKLDRYERLIEVVLLAGNTHKAFDLYQFGVGGYKHLGEILGDNARGLRILSAFTEDGTPATVHRDLSATQRKRLIRDWTLR